MKLAVVDGGVEGDLHVMRDIPVGHFGPHDIGVGGERDVGFDGEGDVVGHAGVVISRELTGVIVPPPYP